LLNQNGKTSPENPIDPELPATGETGLRFRVKTVSGDTVIGATGREGGNEGEKKAAPDYPDAAFEEEAV